MPFWDIFAHFWDMKAHGWGVRFYDGEDLPVGL